MNTTTKKTRRQRFLTVAMYALVGAVCAILQPRIATAVPEEWEDMLDMLSRESAKLTTFTLPNGVNVILKPDNAAPVVSVQFWIATGSIHEDVYLGAGISHAVEHMIFKGTPTLEPGEVSRIIQEAGGQLNAYTTLDRTVYYANLPADKWKTAFDTYADSIFNAEFPEEEWDSEKKVIRREIAMGADDPNRVLIRNLWQTAARVAPFRHPVIGYTDAFDTVSREDLIKYHQKQYTPPNTTLVIVGDIDADAVREHISNVLSAIPRLPSAPVYIPEEPPQATPRTARFSAPHNITRIAQVWPVPVFPDPDSAALEVLAYLAGDGRTSLLQRSLVEEEALLLGISAWYFDRGFWGISGQMEPQQEKQAIPALDREVEKLRAIEVSEEDVAEAVRSQLTSTLNAFTTMGGQASHYGMMHHMTGSPKGDRILVEQIASVTPEDVSRVAREWLKPHTRTQVVVGPEPEEDEIDATVAGQTQGDIKILLLPNGVRLLIKQNPRLPFIYIAGALKGGLLSEGEDKAGITALMAELLTRGTQTRTRDDIAKAIESKGASLSTFSGFNSFGFRGQALKHDTQMLIDIATDILLHPVFPEEEVEKQRSRQIASIQRTQEQPLSQTMQELRELLFPGHPYQNIPDGTEESVRAITRDDIIAHHAKLTKTENLVIAVYGDIDPVAIQEQIAANLQNLPKGQAPETAYALPEPIADKNRTDLQAPRQQAIVITGFPALDIFDPAVDACNILQTVLSGMSSPLFEEIREKRGLAYFTGASQQAGLHPGFFALYAGTTPDDASEVEKLLNVEIERILQKGLTEQEYERAKAQMLASHDMKLQNQLSMAMDAALNELYGLGAKHTLEFPKRMQNISIEDVNSIARKIFKDSDQRTAVLIPEDAAPEPTSNAGTVSQ